MVDVEEQRAQGIESIRVATEFLVVTQTSGGVVNVRGSYDLVATGGLLAYLTAWQAARIQACFVSAIGEHENGEADHGSQ